jgi:hypothetical protein
MEWTTLNVSTISDTAYCFHTFITFYKVSYMLYYFITDVINNMKCPTDEWLTASTFFNHPRMVYQSPVQNFYRGFNFNLILR